MNAQEINDAKWQAAAQLKSIREMVGTLKHAEQIGDAEKQEKAQEAIQNDALSVEVRSNWHEPGSELEIFEYRILLCTGGPAVQIIGELNKWKEPETAWIEYRDWGTSWTIFPLNAEEEEDVLRVKRITNIQMVANDSALDLWRKLLPCKAAYLFYFLTFVLMVSFPAILLSHRRTATPHRFPWDKRTGAIS